MAKQTLDQYLDQALRSIMLQGKRADQIVGSILRENRTWLPEWKNDFVGMVYGIVANWRRLWFILDLDPEREWTPVVTASLRVSWSYLSAGSHPNGDNNAEGKTFNRRLLKSGRTVALRDSWPDWLDELGQSAWSDQWSAISAALHRPAPVFIRTNTLKTNPTELQSSLSAERINSHPVADFVDALHVDNSVRKLMQSSLSRNGAFEVQDLHSQAVALFCSVAPGQVVADVCAGEGGKTLHLACLMQNKGRLLVSDIAEWKLNNLKLRARRAGVSNMEIVPASDQKRWKRLSGKVDTVLLDVPCTGLGSLRRHVDIKWHLSPESLQSLQQTQAQLLQQYSDLPKPGGHLIYATCSILPSEGEEQIKAFIAQSNDKYKLVHEQRLHPADGAGDGFYMARLQRQT